jgi:uncharacterized protein YraI
MNLARLAGSVAIFTALATGVAAAKTVIVAAEVNLRKGPGTDSEIITLIPKGTMVEVGTCTNGWCMVSYDGMDGYSIAPNLGLAPRPVRRPPDYDYPPPPGVYPPPPAYVVGPPVYYDPPPYGPYYYRPYYGGWRGGWGWRHRW